MIRSDLALAALASAAVPGMRPVSVAAIRTGEDNPLHQSALVEDVTGRRWVVRSPLGAAAGAELERNDDLVGQLGKHLPFKVPAAAGYADLGQDGRAVVYPYVEGKALSLRRLPTEPGLASAVGRAIAAVHNMPRELFEEHGVPVFDAAEFRSRRLAELDRAAETGHVPNGLLARWEQALEAAPMWQFATVPTHGSLDGSSFLVVFSEDDAASGRVVGMTGWERAEVADPAEDFSRLVELANPRSVDAVFESYAMARSQRPDGYLLHRARLTSEMRLLNGLAAAVGRDDSAFVRVRADELRKLDRLTANDDSLVPRTALLPAALPVSGSAGETGGAEAQPHVSAAAQPQDVVADDADDVDVDVVIHGDVDGTASVPTALDDQGDEEEPAFVVERPAEGAHLEPAHPYDADDAPKVSPADVTAPIPMFRPVEPTGNDVGRAGRDAALAAPDAESAKDDPDRLEIARHPDVASGDEPAHPGPEGGEAPSSDAELGADAVPADAPGVTAESTERAITDLDDADGPASEVADAETAPTDPVDEATSTETSPVEPADEATSTETSPVDPADVTASTAVTSDGSVESAAGEADERLHTLYGMPDADDVESWESGKP